VKRISEEVHFFCKNPKKVVKYKRERQIGNGGGTVMQMNNSPIQMEWFYYLEGEKTKLNWFLFEIALEYYSRIMESSELKAYKKQYNNKQIALYCTYYARRGKTDVLKYIKGRRKHLHTYKEYIDDYYPNRTNEENDILSKVGNETWEHMLNACHACPQQCLNDYQSRSIFFEKYK